MEKLLEGKIALITGAGRGIGRGIAIAYAKQGATVLINYNGSKERAEAVCEEIRANGGTAESFGFNVADYAASEKAVKDILEKYGRVDILVNNAGITKDNLILKMSEQDFDDVININLKGAFNLIKHLSRNFLKLRHGKIINISSVSGVLGNPGQANYAASKAGIIGLTKSIARELGSRNICVNAIAPGFVETGMTNSLPEAVLEKGKESTVLGRLGRVEDIADAAVFLGSGMADYITGQVLCVDGGMAI